MKAWVQMTSGRGPDECCLAVAELMKVFCRECQSKKIEVDLLEAIAGQRPKTYKSVLLTVDGDALEPYLQSWQGTIQWIHPSPYRPNHGRKNWFVGVNVFLPPEKNANFTAKDIRYEAIRASGPGGQHVNKTSSAIRATHLPSGISVLAQEERSQQMNKKLAAARLFSRLQSQANQAEEALQQNIWDQHNHLERGSPTRVYKAKPLRRAQ